MPDVRENRLIIGVWRFFGLERHAWYRDPVSEGAKDSAKPELAKKEPPEPEWPEHVLRVADCPCLKESSPTNGPVFRFARVPRDESNLLKEKKSWLEADRIGERGPCHSAGLSCYDSIENLKSLLITNPYLKKRCVVRGDLLPEHGLVSPPEASGHVSVWLRTKALREYALLFQEVK